jgi:hypothetical protein
MLPHAVTGNRKKSVFRFGFGFNRHKTENETENTEKPIYKTETGTEKNDNKTKPKKGLFSKINFLNVEKSIIYVFYSVNFIIFTKRIYCGKVFCIFHG